LQESQNKNRDGCPLFPIRKKDQDIERLKRGGCYEREKQRGKGKQEGAAEKPQREEKGEEGEERSLGAHLENHSWRKSGCGRTKARPWVYGAIPKKGASI